MKVKKTRKLNERDIIELLQVLTGKTLKEFTRFVDFQGTPGICEFWSVVKNYYPDYDITDHEIHNLLESKKPFNDRLFRVRLAELSNLIKSYIAYNGFKKDPLLYANVLANSLFKHGLRKAYKKQKQANDALITESRISNAKGYYYLHQKELIDFYFLVSFGPRKPSDSLEQASRYHTLDFLTQKIRYFVILRNYTLVMRNKFDEEEEEHFLEYLKSFDFHSEPVTKCYHLLLLIFRELNNKDIFNQFYDYLFLHIKQFDKPEALNIVSFGANICNWNIRNGQLQFLMPRFKLNKLIIELNLLHNHSSINYFEQILVSAIKADQLEWASKFIQEYLPKKTKENAFSIELNLALFAFAKRDFKQLETHLFTLDQTNVYKAADSYNLLSFRYLKLKIAFLQLGEVPTLIQKDAFIGNLNSFSKYVSRHTDISDYSVQFYLNFTKALRLIYLKRYGKKKVTGNLTTQILEMMPIVGFPWLMQQVEATENSHP